MEYRAAVITGAASDSLDGIGVLRSPATEQRIGTRPLRCGEAEDLDSVLMHGNTIHCNSASDNTKEMME